jgi:hypothetical protein
MTTIEAAPVSREEPRRTRLKYEAAYQPVDEVERRPILYTI